MGMVASELFKLKDWLKRQPAVPNPEPDATPAAMTDTTPDTTPAGDADTPDTDPPATV
jgi:hypothetical protein